MPGLNRSQPKEVRDTVRDTVLPPDLPTVAVEAAAPTCGHEPAARRVVNP